MKKLDQSQRFIFEDHPIRGQYVSLDQSWLAIAQQAGLEGKGLTLLGEALAAVVLLVDTLKIKGTVTLQIRGNGPLGLLVVEASSENRIRGIARQKDKIDEQMSMQEIFGSDCLVITIKNEGGRTSSRDCTAARGQFFRSARILLCNVRTIAHPFLAGLQ